MLEALELDQPRVVTVADLDRLASEHAIGLDGTELAYELRRRGWVSTLRTRGAWEFVPGARAGRFGAGDRHIELRAALALDPSFPGALAMESAAVALGLAGRVPEREVLSLPPGTRLPKAFDGWRVVRLHVEPDDLTRVDDLPLWRVETLLVGMARRPDGYRDWPNVAEWLNPAVARSDLTIVRSALADAPRAAWRRTGYLLAAGGRPNEGIALFDAEPAGRGPVYLGPRNTNGRYDKQFDVIDSVLAPAAGAVER